jgi:hypothetical protein
MAKDLNILQTSTDPKLLTTTAVDFAASDQAAEQAALLRALNSRQFLDRLDSEKELIANPPKALRVAKIIKTLMDNPSPASKQTLLGLARGGDFILSDPRQFLLIRALVVIRPAPPEAVAFWDAQSQPDSIYAGTTIDALCDNGTEPAMALLERKLADPNHEEDARLSWMHTPILIHRNDLPLLQACLRMVTTSLPMELRPALVEALCDYKREWYLTCSPPKPPPRSLATRPAREVLRKICDEAKDHLNLDPGVRGAVDKTLVELDLLNRQP